jgi:hypothetical protein
MLQQSPGVPETPGQRRRRLLLSVLSALERSTKGASVDGSVGLLVLEDDEPGTIYSAKFAGSNHTQSVSHGGAGASSQAAHHSPESEDERVGGGRNSIFASGKEANKSLSNEISKSSNEIRKSSSEINKKLSPPQVQSSSSSVVSVSSSIASSTSPRRPKHAFLKKHEGVLSSIVSPEKRSPSLHQSSQQQGEVGRRLTCNLANKRISVE